MKGFPAVASSPTKSRNKKKMSSVLSKYEKNEHAASFRVEVRKKIIDGNEVITAKVCRDRYDGGAEPLQKEYTDMAKFKKDLVDQVQRIGKALK